MVRWRIIGKVVTGVIHSTFTTFHQSYHPDFFLRLALPLLPSHPAALLSPDAERMSKTRNLNSTPRLFLLILIWRGGICDACKTGGKFVGI